MGLRRRWPIPDPVFVIDLPWAQDCSPTTDFEMWQQPHTHEEQGSDQCNTICDTCNSCKKSFTQRDTRPLCIKSETKPIWMVVVWIKSQPCHLWRFFWLQLLSSWPFSQSILWRRRRCRSQPSTPDLHLLLMLLLLLWGSICCVM